MNARADPSGAVARVLARLRDVKSGASGRTGLCPAHEDKENSLSVEEGEDGRALVTCFAGIDPDALVLAGGDRGPAVPLLVVST